MPTPSLQLDAGGLGGSDVERGDEPMVLVKVDKEVDQGDDADDADDHQDDDGADHEDLGSQALLVDEHGQQDDDDDTYNGTDDAKDDHSSRGRHEGEGMEHDPGTGPQGDGGQTEDEGQNQ